MKKLFESIAYMIFVAKKKIQHFRNKRKNKSYDPFIY